MDTKRIEALERATLAAVGSAAAEEWPGWLLGLDRGTVGRAHSAVPLSHAAPNLAALDPIEARYRSHGLTTVFLQLDAANSAARSLYRRAGLNDIWTYEYWREKAPHPRA